MIRVRMSAYRALLRVRLIDRIEASDFTDIVVPSFERLLMVELWLSFLYGSYNGAMVVTLTEVMPAAVRTTGFSLAYSLATALFGGFTPAISTYLIHSTGNKAAPGLWLMFAAVCGLLATLVIFRVQREQAALRPA